MYWKCERKISDCIWNLSTANKDFYFCSVTLLPGSRRTMAEREIKFYFITRRIIARRAIKLTLFPADTEKKWRR